MLVELVKSLHDNIKTAVYNHWTGLVDWTGGMHYWTQVFFPFHQILVNWPSFVI